MKPERMMRMPATITLRSPDGIDEYGDEQLTESTVVLPGHPGSGVYIEPIDSDESGDSTNVQTETYRLFAPSGVVIDGAASIEVRGHTYELVGTPGEFSKPDETVSFFTAKVKRVR